MTGLWDLYFDGCQLAEIPTKFPPRLNGIKVRDGILIQLVCQVSGNLLKQLPDSVGGGGMADRRVEG